MSRRLIDADALLKQFSECNFKGYVLKGLIESAPTIDAVEVVHGEWIHGCTNGAGTEYCYCSECMEDALKDTAGYTEFSDFCPHCGAKMDGNCHEPKEATK